MLEALALIWIAGLACYAVSYDFPVLTMPEVWG